MCPFISKSSLMISSRQYKPSQLISMHLIPNGSISVVLQQRKGLLRQAPREVWTASWPRDEEQPLRRIRCESLHKMTNQRDRNRIYNCLWIPIPTNIINRLLSNLPHQRLRLCRSRNFLQHQPAKHGVAGSSRTPLAMTKAFSFVTRELWLGNFSLIRTDKKTNPQPLRNFATQKALEGLIAFATTDNPDILYWDEAMKAHDRDKFIEAISVEMDSHERMGNYKPIPIDKVPSGTKLLTWSGP